MCYTTRIAHNMNTGQVLAVPVVPDVPTSPHRPRRKTRTVALLPRPATDAKSKVKMSSENPGATYTALLANLRAAMKALAKHIEPKVYENEFLKR